MSAEYQPNLSFVSQIPAEFLKLREYSANPDISWIFFISQPKFKKKIRLRGLVRGGAPAENEVLAHFELQKRGTLVRMNFWHFLNLATATIQINLGGGFWRPKHRPNTALLLHTRLQHSAGTDCRPGVVDGSGRGSTVSGRAVSGLRRSPPPAPVVSRSVQSLALCRRRGTGVCRAVCPSVHSSPAAATTATSPTSIRLTALKTYLFSEMI